MSHSEDFEGGFVAATTFLEKSNWKLADPEGQHEDRAGVPHLGGTRMLVKEETNLRELESLTVLDDGGVEDSSMIMNCS